MSAAGASPRVPVLYLAPWVDYGGSDKGTIDWFRWLDRDRFAPSLITTQTSANRRLAEVIPYASEVWNLPDMLHGEDFPPFILDFIHTRCIRVVHLMNSRLGFDLLPDFGALPDPPAVVVQLHVEEEDRSGYVRYVTTRYGNLVDGFSVTSRQLADAIVRDYDVPRGKCHVIYTGVDAEGEFSPDRVSAVNLTGDGATHILYPGRLVEQKDPLLMVEVAAALRESGEPFRIHSIGEGELEGEVRAAISAHGLKDHVLLHGAVSDVPRWFAASDLALLTSRFEGVPYVVFEAMAMGVPVVAPALPGTVEVMAQAGGVTVSPRDRAPAYARALLELMRNPEARRRAAEQAREEARRRHSLRSMAHAHEALYEDLLRRRTATRPPQNRATHAEPRPPEPIALARRPFREQPLVSVVVPCFNHGQWLGPCLESIREQTYPHVETIVSDDASFESETLEVLERLEREGEVVVVRQKRNGGPSVARNAGIARARGRYILPVDADNLLLPTAVTDLLEQLQAAGEQIGYVYPNSQYFGNRKDYFEAPAYNLYALMQGNFCDTCSLLDRAVFDQGAHYAEDIRLGHEDWDFVLQLAERGVHGEPARSKTLLYRKHGFTRSDTVEHGPDAFHEIVRDRHPALYGASASIKARWSPALSIVGLDSVPPAGEARERLSTRLVGQTCEDVELLSCSDGEWPPDTSGPHLRRLPAQLADGPAAALADGIEAARGRYVLATRGSGSGLLADRAFVEKLLRTFLANPGLGAIAFTDAGERGRFPFRLLVPEDGAEPEPHAVAWTLGGDTPLRPVALDDEDALRTLTVALSSVVPVQWRHMPHSRGLPDRRPSRWRDLQPFDPGDKHPLPTAAAADREWRLEAAPLLPRVPKERFRRLVRTPTWMPPLTHNLCRHVNRATGMRIVTPHREPPPGYTLEHDIGVINRFPLQGTLPLVSVGDGADYLATDEAPDGSTLLGHVETAPFPMLEALLLAVHGETGQRVLVAGPHDGLIGAVEPIATLGFIELFPINPRRAPHVALPYGTGLGLVRSVDRRRRRHRYGVGSIPAGEVAGELGSLHPRPDGNGEPVWLTRRGEVVTGAYRPTVRRPRLRATARWVLAPAAWREFATPDARARAVCRRALGSLRHLVRLPRLLRPHGEPVGYLFREPAPSRLPLYAAMHPVTGDQLLSPWPLEIADMGYGQPVLLGYLVANAPVTGRIRVERVPVPWASRFGRVARTGI